MSDSVFLVLVVLVFLGLAALWVAALVHRHRSAHPRVRRGADGVERWVVDGGLRLVGGDAPGVTRRWRHGRVVAEPGVLTLRPYLMGLKIVPGTPVSVAVQGVDLTAEVEAGLKDMAGVRPGSRIIPVATTTGATLQLALLSSRTDGFFAALAARPAPAA